MAWTALSCSPNSRVAHRRYRWATHRASRAVVGAAPGLVQRVASLWSIHATSDGSSLLEFARVDLGDAVGTRAALRRGAVREGTSRYFFAY